MPNKNNAKKALRQSIKHAAANKEVKDAFRKAMKDVTKAIKNEEADITAKVQLAQKKIDKAAKKGIIKPNTAARKFSRLMKKVNAAKK
ncbi:30S ribosomal protein S20 [Patescibacteria group bacterium]|nr:30S ribosomal protein S20 [Patescibacteria group bacterium]MBU1721307.1 30S ribosomal protein S20 [Patescibacteria group bacterium]MBU1900817.1 30S ribosomal protein S20 [Patescibacteria group bacterium]